jgi:alpha-tubulin suppressor-like RCC1 family protein
MFGYTFGNSLDTKHELTLVPNSTLFHNENIRMATHGMYHLLILKKDDTLYSCGRNNKG